MCVLITTEIGLHLSQIPLRLMCCFQLIFVFSETLKVFLNAFCQFGKCLYVTVRRLSNRFLGESSGYFRCLCVCECICTSKCEF